MRECKYNCKEDGPPGPIWCTWCGHDPSCCNCDDENKEGDTMLDTSYWEHRLGEVR